MSRSAVAFGLAVALGAAGCSRCGGAASVPDAGPRAFEAGARVSRRSVDLRTVLIQAYPEYRGTKLLDARAQVTRVVPGLTAAQRDQGLATLGYVALDGGTGWFRKPFTIEQPAADALVVWLPLSAEAIGHLYVAPAGLSSEELALYLPRGLPVAREDFEVTLHWVTAPERALDLVRQAARLLAESGLWKVTAAPEGFSVALDAGPLAPDELEVTVEGPQGARITWRRVRGQVEVTYRLATVGARAP